MCSDDDTEYKTCLIAGQQAEMEKQLADLHIKTTELREAIHKLGNILQQLTFEVAKLKGTKHE